MLSDNFTGGGINYVDGGILYGSQGRIKLEIFAERAENYTVNGSFL